MTVSTVPLLIATSALIGAIVVGCLNARREHKALTGRADRDLNEMPKDVHLAAAVKLVAGVIAEDLGVSASKIHVYDNLREDLGYVVDRIAVVDTLDYLLSEVADKTSVTTIPTESCSTVLDIAKHIASANYRLEAGSNCYTKNPE